MCELFGMSARHPTDVNHSLRMLQPRGGEIGPHADGWGVAFYEGRAARIFKEPVPACESRCLAFIAEYEYRSSMVIAHIRKANPSQYGRSTANTHPFERELEGRSWVFAHNGKLPGIREDPHFALRRFRPKGDTDSEHAFCYLLDKLWDARQQDLADPGTLRRVLQKPIQEVAALGECNLLMGDGRHLLAFANTRLSMVERYCSECGSPQAVTLFATVPLTEEPWQALENNRMYLFALGRSVSASPDTASLAANISSA